MFSGLPIAADKITSAERVGNYLVGVSVNGQLLNLAEFQAIESPKIVELKPTGKKRGPKVKRRGRGPAKAKVTAAPVPNGSDGVGQEAA